MKLVEQFDNMVGHITSINDERDVVSLLLGLQELWPQVRSEIARLRAEKIEQEQEWAAVCAERERSLQAALKSKITIHEAEIRILNTAMGVRADEIARLGSLADNLGQDNERFIREIDLLKALIEKTTGFTADELKARLGSGCKA